MFIKSIFKNEKKFILKCVLGYFIFSIGFQLDGATNPNNKKSPNLLPKKNHACFLAKNKVCTAIMKLTPTLNPDDAMRLSTDFIAVAKEKKLPVPLLVSIAKQESNFRLDVIRMVEGLVEENGVYKRKKVGTDFCMMQINAFNIDRLGLDANKLVKDARYCISAGADILSSFKRFKGKQKHEWWTRYNAVSEVHREIYQRHVLVHWRELDPQLDNQICQQTPAPIFPGTL